MFCREGVERERQWSFARTPHGYDDVLMGRTFRPDSPEPAWASVSAATVQTGRLIDI